MADSEELRCPRCGEKIYRTDDTCLGCGARLDEGRLVEDEAPPQPATPSQRTEQGSARAAATPGASQHRPTNDPGVTPYQTAPPGRWHPRQMTGDSGFWASLSRGWAFARESIAMGFRDTDVFVPSIISVFVNLAVAGVFFGIMYATGQLGPLLDDEQTAEAWTYVVTVIFVFGGYILSYFLTAMTVNMVDAHLRGQDAQLGVAFADARQNILAIIWLAVVATVVNMLTSAMRKKQRGGLSDLAADAIDKAWLVASYLLLPIIIIEDVPFSTATKRATKLHGQSVIQVVVGEVGLTILQKVLGFVLFIIGVVPAVLAYFISPALLVFGIGWAVMVIVFTTAFMMYLRTAFYTCVYLWAAANEAAGQDVAAPEPLERAMAA
ncbi:MAG: DUF6159 family protein [Armatimonadota bacterium]